jgi:hypothetical protein
MKTYQKTLVSLALALAMSPAMAWGDREQGILQGLAGAWILGRVLQNQPAPEYTAPPPPVYVYPPVAPPPAVYYHRPTCYHVPHYDHWGRVAYYRQICR